MSKKRCALSGPLPAKRAANLATTATSVSEDKLASILSKLWDFNSYALNFDVTGHSKYQQRAMKTLEKTTQFSDERYDVASLR